MSDHRTRLAAREPMTVEEEAEELLRRQRAGLIRQVDVGLCGFCGGSPWFNTDIGVSLAPVGEKPIRCITCPDCNGTGRRYRSGLELAAFCGHEAARLALEWPERGPHWPGWWHGLRYRFGGRVLQAAYAAAGVPEDDRPREFAWFARVSAQSSQVATEQAKAALIRWALT